MIDQSLEFGLLKNLFHEQNAFEHSQCSRSARERQVLYDMKDEIPGKDICRLYF